eukprot:TRINITY_DN1760_c2_g1_i1.p1 TRINITY_DN1760_c2_g1~~TRINITY_DN1760_c2_g1_i1.p1  ORF type:complete len:913 (+),score=277.43 TRINITY_DN1760_c2_g1_i1:78-2741(+)
MGSGECLVLTLGGAQPAESLAAALTRAGAASVTVLSGEEAESDPRVAAAAHLVVTAAPWVCDCALSGALEGHLRDRVRAGRPTLCSGAAAALLPALAGGGIAPVHNADSSSGETWAEVAAVPGCRVLRAGAFYFPKVTASFAAAPLGWGAAWRSGTRELAGLERGCVAGCFFAPELSGAAGAEVLNNWLASSPTADGGEQPEQQTGAHACAQVAALLTVSSTEGITPERLDAVGRSSADALVLLVETRRDAETAAQAAVAAAAGLPLPVIAECAAPAALQPLLAAAAPSIAVPARGGASAELLQQVRQTAPRRLCVLLEMRFRGGVAPEAAGASGAAQLGLWEWVEDGEPCGEGSLRSAAESVTAGGALLVLRGAGGVDPAALLKVAAAAVRAVADHGAAGAPVWLGLPDLDASDAAALAAAAGVQRLVFPLSGVGRLKGAMCHAAGTAPRPAPAASAQPRARQPVVACIEMCGAAVVAVATGGCEALRESPDSAVAHGALLGEVAVVDIAASAAHGGAAARLPLLAPLMRRYRLRVGGGVRTLADAEATLGAGAARVIVGFAPDGDQLPLFGLPRGRVTAALDGQMSGGCWVSSWGAPLTEAVAAAAARSSNVMVTLVDPGRPGVDLDCAAAMAQVCTGAAAQLTLAVPRAAAAELRALDSLGIEVQVPYSTLRAGGSLPLPAAAVSLLRPSASDGTFPVVVADAVSGAVLGMHQVGQQWVHDALERRRADVPGVGPCTVCSVAPSAARDAVLCAVQQDSGAPAAGVGVPPASVALLQAAQELAWECGGVRRQLPADADLLRGRLATEADELSRASTPQQAARRGAEIVHLVLARCAAAGVDVGELCQLVGCRRGQRGVTAAAGAGAGEAALTARAKDAAAESVRE